MTVKDGFLKFLKYPAYVPKKTENMLVPTTLLVCDRYKFKL